MTQLAETPALATTTARQGQRGPVVLISLSLFVMTAAIFWPACGNGFVNWDDNSYVCNRLEVLNGLTSPGLLWATTAEVCGNWHPLTLISLQLDAQLFGPGPVGFHRTSVLLHALNAAMAFLAIFALTGCLWRSAIVAILFAIHPFRVESVAWVSERKDLLSGFFFATLLAYARYTAMPSLGRYLLVAGMFALGLCSKSILVTTPCVLLLLDDWPLRRLWRPTTTAHPAISRLILEKIPLLGLSALSSLLTIKYQGAAISSAEHSPLSKRIKNAIASDVEYVLQTFWPTDLSPIYVMREIGVGRLIAATTFLILLTAYVVSQRRRQPYLLVGWLWFLGMLVPVCGIIQVGSQARADRYTYLPSVGLFLAIVWGLANVEHHWRRFRLVSLTAAATILGGCGLITIKQIAVWHDTESLWRQAYRLYPHDGIVLQHLITSLANKGKKDDAIKLTDEALRVTDEADGNKMVMLAMLLAVLGKHESCAETLGKAIHHFPEKAELFSNRGKAYAALRRWQDAADDYRQAIKLAPRSASFHFYLAHALAKAGQEEEAREIFDEASKRSPRWAQNAARDAWRMSTSPDFRERQQFWPICLAEQAMEAAGQESPQHLDVLAAAYAQSDQFDEAVATARKALQQAENSHQSPFANGVRERLKLYEQHEPYREYRPKVNPVP